MALSPGTRFGAYDILGAPGAGGMSARGRGERAGRAQPPGPGGGAPGHFLKLTDLAHAGAWRWR
jgi:hypothetical protein